MENQTSPETNNNSSWFSEISWKTALLCAAIGLVSGGGSGAGVAASKAVSPSGVTQDQADIRYLSRSESDRITENRDKQLEAIKNSMVTREVFQAYMESIKDEQNRQRQLLEKLLER